MQCSTFALLAVAPEMFAEIGAENRCPNCRRKSGRASAAQEPGALIFGFIQKGSSDQCMTM
jgi:hypothetical protein